MIKFVFPANKALKRLFKVQPKYFRMKQAKITSGILLAIFFTITCFIACKKNDLQSREPQGDPNLPATPYSYLDKHSVNDNLATLGRVLFYDQSLSVNDAVSCGSCHKQEFAFANNVKFDKGFNGLPLNRNSPSIQGIRGFFGSQTFQFVNDSFQMIMTDSSGMPTINNQNQVLLFWDGRQRSVADMVLNPVLNHNEMNVPDFETLVNKLNGLSYYPDLFKKAFGNETITKERIAFALEGFISCLNTGSNTQVFANDNLTDMQQLGKTLFHEKYNCAKCHDQGGSFRDPNFTFGEPSFNNGSGSGQYGPATDPSQMFNIGLDEVYSDQGLGRLTKLPGDNGLFKVPTLKNISVTAPYMHDGRFANLGEVLDHYSHNIKANNNLTTEFKNLDGTPKSLNISPIEKSAIIAFLSTLKDEDFLTSPMYSDPFKK